MVSAAVGNLYEVEGATSWNALALLLSQLWEASEPGAVGNAPDATASQILRSAKSDDTPAAAVDAEQTY